MLSLESLSDGVESEPDSDGDPSETELTLSWDEGWSEEDHESSTVEYELLPDSDGVEIESLGDPDSEPLSDWEPLEGEPSETELSLLSDGLPEDGVLLDEL